MNPVVPDSQAREPLSRHTSLKVGGPADEFILATSPDEATHALKAAVRARMSVSIIGGGSNLLVADEGVEGVVLKYAAAQHRVEQSVTSGLLVADAGCSFPGVARRAARQGWAGLEWAVSVPGTVGGAVVNNAGAFGSCVAECLVWAEAIDEGGQLHRLGNADLQYEYRTSRLKRHELGGVVVIRAAFRLERGDPGTIRERVQTNQNQRTLTQPRELSAGSTFANPPGDFSGRLIEAAGLKGRSEGGAQISHRHANFIVNAGGATARDVYTLMRTVQEAVRAASGVWLCPEIELLGRWSSQDVDRLYVSDYSG